MLRLALATVAALAVHFLLLMAEVPEPQVIMPEIKGSGQVTVSIIRPVTSPPEPQELDKKVVEKKHIQKEKESPTDVEEITPVPPEVKPIPEDHVQEEQMPVPVEQLQVAEPVSEPETRDTVTEKPEPVVAAIEKNKTISKEISAFTSDQETLQYPQPIPHSNRPPGYPPLARKRGWEGTVILEVDIRSDGMVKDIQIHTTSNYEMLDNEAMRAVSKWSFQPGSKGGKYVDMKVLVPVHFVLEKQ